MNTKVYPGNPYPLGATWDGKGVNFALHAENADAIELCFFDEQDATRETGRIRLKERSHHVWHCYLPDAKPGMLYAYRVHGRYEPEKGYRFNPNKVLLDPYAKAVSGVIDWDDSLFGYEMGHPDEDLSFSTTDSAPFLPKAVVVDPAFDWEGDQQLKIPYQQTIIYEAHVKGLTKLHHGIPENIRGTYSAIGHPVMIGYLKELGITAIELMPVHQFINDRILKDRGISNYWGYNTIGFFAPDVRYSSSGVRGEQVREFKQMVKNLHQAGIEVILDVVYNHTAEGNHMGPTLSFRGIDNREYYRLTGEGRYYMDYTGTGNTLNAMVPCVLRLIMDSLRYWITEMHVDGFRFDLAATLARELHEVDRLGSFFDIIHQDPVISQVKLIAEPWDIGEGGYQVGKFPPGWAEWNGKYRDSVRDFWRGAEHSLPEFAKRFTGSPDLYFEEYRHPFSSINFITAHDGFTLNDLVTFHEKYNMENGEDNKDGEDHNRSWNCGTEGPTADEAVNQLRDQQKRNLLVTLFLSQGVPMLLAGDELSRTQNGNNNAYCQDNEISWLSWQRADENLLAFTQKLIRFYKQHPVFARRRWFKGKPVKNVQVPDIAWFLPDGSEMNEEHWENGSAKSVAVYLNGMSLRSWGPKGEEVLDDNFFVVLNASDSGIDYNMPEGNYGGGWKKVVDTAGDFVLQDAFSGSEDVPQVIHVPAHSITILQQKNE